VIAIGKPELELLSGRRRGFCLCGGHRLDSLNRRDS
jgi:hypothetical protein